MRHRWLLDVDGRRVQLDAKWDLLLTSRGKAWLDGVQVATWWPGSKIPGIKVTVPVYGRSVCLVGLTGDFDIDLLQSPGVASVAPLLPSTYTPSARVRAQRTLMWVVLSLSVGLPLLAGVVAAVLWALGGWR